MCEFNMAWVGKCKVVGACPEHDGLVCDSCGKPATHTCDETGQFVCGAPLCEECERTINEDGTNGGVGFNQKNPHEGMKTHCRKTEQKYLPWYERTLSELGHKVS